MSNRDRTAPRDRGRTLVAVVVVVVLLVAALFAAIGSLNREVYSAGGFVRQYLDALARHDTASALTLPGVTPTTAELTAAGLPTELPDTLLRASVLSSITAIRLVSDTVKPDAADTGTGTGTGTAEVHSVIYAFDLDGAPETMEFRVARAGTYAAVFDSWRFDTSPLAVLGVTVLHEASFSVNGLTLDTRAHAAADAPVTFSNQAAYLAFAPARYTIAHESALLSAAPQSVPVTQSGATDVSVDAEPNASFVGQVQSELNAFLDSCATQTVLQPSDCPFGIEINDRVKSVPTWSIPEYPAVTLAAGDTAFDMPATAGRAHIKVAVQSLFDGDLSTRDEDVPFAVAIQVVVGADGSLAIQLR
ncbi:MULTISPECIES: hypothetical protein [unclassified Cryobacterium]|uniref:hypothetical protein n=1 Tax=unclassified Cryobacterium TaxID=2649013 RepID=UPI0010696B92|nr:MULTISPECIES: hypothetical protein [unclassified Cryobacterium]TFB95775.1 hypothetical protein E3O39_12190 [Cryobacterium sp. MDB2-A-1]TFC04442.1 hypothetical protein E3O59_14230 [Cryobacterium sp. MDB2-33-2]TFC12088.1 hypothetical protein E3O35_09750 [Cryobacterium sp. MDB2-A-2]TFC15979.1 hypothetical protein E3O51_13295 [Cryobacterium sp. MDB2-10]